MNRLRDDAPTDPVVAEGISILKSVSSTPVLPDAKRRVWAALCESTVEVRRRGKLRPARFRFAVVVTLSVCIVGTAGAVISRRWIAPLLRASAMGTAPTTSHAPIAKRRTAAAQARSDVGSGAESGAKAIAAPSAPPAATAVLYDANAAIGGPATASQRMASRKAASQKRIAMSGSRSAAREARDTREAGASVSAAANPMRFGRRNDAPIADSALSVAPTAERGDVLAALIALRREHDAGRATELLDRYRLKYPNGVLREEALVLSIEAATLRHDSASVERLARVYRASFPNGRFRSFVESASH